MYYVIYITAILIVLKLHYKTRIWQSP